MALTFSKLAPPARELSDVSFTIFIKLVALLPPLTCFDKVCRALTMKVFWKCLNDPSIKVGVTMNGYIFDHPRGDFFSSGKGENLVEKAWKELGQVVGILCCSAKGRSE